MMTPKEIRKAVRSVIGGGKHPMHVPFHPTTAKEEMMLAISEVVDPVGYDCVDQFQAELAKECGVEQCLVVSSGTAALHLALIIVGVKPYTEVFCPTLTFVGAANAISYCGAIPNFIDSREHDLGVNPFKLSRYIERICERRPEGVYNKQSGRKVSGLIAVDLAGVPSDLEQIRGHCDQWGIPVIEDAAQALGSQLRLHPCGGNAPIAIMSFNGNKIITTNGGGALLTNDPFIQARAWSLATTARVAHPYRMDHTEIAYNYRMGNINAALGLAQLRNLNELILNKSKLYNAYAAAGLNVGIEAEGDDTNIWNHWLNILTLPPLDHSRDQICAALIADGISCRTLFSPIHDLPMYMHCPRDNLEGAQDIWRRTICLPSSAYLGEQL